MKKGIFVHIPKTAGKSVLFEIRKRKLPVLCFGHKKMIEIINNKNNDLRNIVRNVKHIKVNVDEYISFAFVRNPYDRFLSSYHFYKDIYTGKRGVNIEIGKYKSFNDFCLNFKNFKYKNDLQFIEQKKFLYNTENKKIVNFIGKFENLDDEWKKLCDLLEIEYDKLPIKNASKHKNWEEVYDDKMKNIVYNLFSEDFECFGYEK